MNRPHLLPSCEPCHKKDVSREGFSLPEGGVIKFNASEMLTYIEYVQKYVKIQPRTLAISEPVKNSLKSNKNNPAVIQFFPLRKILDIIRQGEDRLQLARFRELMDESEERNW